MGRINELVAVVLVEKLLSTVVHGIGYQSGGPGQITARLCTDCA